MSNDLNSANVRSVAVPLVGGVYTNLLNVEALAAAAAEQTTFEDTQAKVQDIIYALGLLHTACADARDGLISVTGDPDGDIANESGGTNKN